jgi:hypothetical protein
MKLKNILNEINNSEIKLIDEISMNRLFTKHFTDGFIIITSYRHENSIETNKKEFENLKRMIRSKDYSFIPVYGGYIETTADGKEKEVLEPSLLVTNHKISNLKEKPDINDLKKLGLHLIQKGVTSKYGQDSFLFKPAGNNDVAFYITKSGSVDMKFTSKSVNDMVQKYFTALNKSYKAKKNQTDKQTARFTFEGFYINTPPTCMSNAAIRYGEEFFSF